MTEADFQKKIISHYRKEGHVVLAITVIPGIPLGFPDVLILGKSGRWALLECKASKNASFRPLQKLTIAKLHKWGYARAVYPENWEEIRHELERYIV